jgi:hypothetical protein
MTPQQLDEMERLYQEGWNSVQLGQRYGRTPPTIRYHLRKRGATLRSCGEANRLRAPGTWSQVDERRLRELHERGLRTREIGVELGVSVETVRRHLRDEQTGVPKNISPEGRCKLQEIGRRLVAWQKAKASRRASGSGARRSR